MKKNILSLLLITGLSTYTFGGDRFSRDNDKEVVIDNATNLIWQDNSDAKTIKKNWKEAINYCENLTLGGYSDWYLPNINQLYSIADKTKYKPAIDPTFQNVVSNYCWSSTTSASGSSNACYVNFGCGNGSWDDKSSYYYVRCVRDNN